MASPNGTPLQHRVEMFGVDAAGLLMRLFPVRRAASIMGGLGVVAGSALRIRRSRVDRHLAIAFPEKSAAARRQIARGAYRHLAAQASILFRLADDPDKIEPLLARVAIAEDGSRGVLEWMKSRARGGEGTLVLQGHFGNWEIGGATVVRHGIPIHGVAALQSNRQFTERVATMRRLFGIEVIPRHLATKEVPRALSRGCTVMLAADQFTWDGVPILFFDEPTLGARGPSVFARRAKVPTVLASVHVAENDPTGYTLNLERFDEVIGTSGHDATRAFTQQYFDRLERIIRERPEQYLWHHRRWRSLEGRVDPAALAALRGED